jgi:hypothetical protein
MTLTRWWLAVVVVSLGVGESWGQSCGRAGAEPPGESNVPCKRMPEGQRAVRAPYYDEVADILFPAPPPTPCQATPCSSPEACRSLFEAVARCQAEQAQRSAAFLTATGFPMEFYRQMCLRQINYFLETGHYGAADYLARVAMQQFPTCPDFWQAQVKATAYALRDRAAAMMPLAGDHEACEEPAPAKDKGGCAAAKGAVCGVACGSAKGGCGCQAGAVKCGACAADCKCCKEGCCDKDCCCGKPGGTCCCTNGCCQANGVRVIVIRFGCMGEVMNRVKLEKSVPAPAASPAPKPCACPGVPAQQSSAAPASNTIRLATKHFDATADNLYSVPGDKNRVLLQGHVSVEYKITDRPARIVAEGIIINLTDGSFEVQGARSIGTAPGLSITPAYWQR